MSKKEYHFLYEEYASLVGLDEKDARLLQDAAAIAEAAYAPYSHFKVGAVALLNNGELVAGTNQENASYPVGICAERTLLAAAGTKFPDTAIRTMAITYLTSTNMRAPLSPCGMCRQALQEFEARTGQPIRLIMGHVSGRIYIIENASLLLPLAFSSSMLSSL